MNQPISRQQHGIADYMFAPLVASAPESIGFTEEKTAVTLCRVLGAGALAYTVFTKAEWGLVKVLPFKAHLVIEAAASLFTLSAPWVFGFAHNTKARNAFLAFGATSATIGALTRPEEMGEVTSAVL